MKAVKTLPEYQSWSCGVVVITSALHAEGPQFDPGRDQLLLRKQVSDDADGGSSLPCLCLQSTLQLYTPAPYKSIL